MISVVGHPSSVRAYGPATFPVGEGFLRRGLLDFGFAKSFFIPQYVATPPELRGRDTIILRQNRLQRFCQLVLLGLGLCQVLT